MRTSQTRLLTPFRLVACKTEIGINERHRNQPDNPHLPPWSGEGLGAIPLLVLQATSTTVSQTPENAATLEFTLERSDRKKKRKRWVRDNFSRFRDTVVLAGCGKKAFRTLLEGAVRDASYHAQCRRPPLPRSAAHRSHRTNHHRRRATIGERHDRRLKRQAFVQPEMS